MSNSTYPKEAYGNRQTIRGNYSDGQDRLLIVNQDTHWVMTATVEYTVNNARYVDQTELQVRTHTIEIRAPHQARDGRNLISWYNTMKTQYPNATLSRQSSATVIESFSEEQLSTINCPCTTHRRSITTSPTVRPCKAFRPNDIVNGGVWRSEITNLLLEGSPSQSTEEYNSKVVLALAKHDKALGGYPQSVAAQEKLNDEAQINRTVANEVKKLEAASGDQVEAFGSMSAFGDLANCELNSAVGAFDSYWGTVVMPRRSNFTMFDRSTTHYYNKGAGSNDLNDGVNMKYVIVSTQGYGAVYFRLKSEALKFFKWVTDESDYFFDEWLVSDPLPSIGTVEAQS